MDYTSTRLADEMQIPHRLAVKKVKKYAGGNKGKAGTIYKKMNRKRLVIVPMGRGDDEKTIYQFSKDGYDACVSDEARYYEKMRDESRERGVAAWSDTSKGLRKRYESLYGPKAKKK